MKLSAPSLAALSQLSQYIGKQGMTAEIQSSTPVAGGVEAHVQLRSPVVASAPMNKLRAWYAGLQQREQRMVAVGGVAVAVLILVFGILLPLQARRLELRSDGNATKREDLAWMQVNAPEIRAAASTAARGHAARRRWCWWTGSGREAGLAEFAARHTTQWQPACACSWRPLPFDALVAMAGHPRRALWVSRLNRSPWIALPGREW